MNGKAERARSWKKCAGALTLFPREQFARLESQRARAYFAVSVYVKYTRGRRLAFISPPARQVRPLRVHYVLRLHRPAN